MQHLRLLLVIGALCATSLLSAAVIYVNQFASGNNTGTDWPNAFTDLQLALAMAQAGDEIWVVSGEYFPTTGTDREATFSIPTGVALYGGFGGSETERDQRDWAAGPTFLNGNLGNLNLATDNSYTVVTITDPDSTNVLDGFTIMNGSADDTSIAASTTYSPTRRGGGIMILTTGDGAAFDYYLTIRNCTFAGNEAEYGGAIYGDARDNNYIALQVVNCTFERNSADFGAVYASERGNTGTPEVLFENSRFLRNQNIFGGAIYLVVEGAEEGGLTVRDCEFINNQGELLDVNLSNLEIPYHFTVQRCRFIGNESDAGVRPFIEFRTNSDQTNIIMDSVLFEDNSNILHVLINGKQVHLSNIDFVNNNRITGNLITSYCDLLYLKNCSIRGNKVQQILETRGDSAWIDQLTVLDNVVESGSTLRFRYNYLEVNNSLFARYAYHPDKNAISSEREGGEMIFTNCTFYNYRDGFTGAFLNSNYPVEDTTLTTTVRFQNSILWDNLPVSAPLFSLRNDEIVLSHSLINTADCANSFVINNLIGLPGVNSEVICDSTSLLQIDPLFTDTLQGDFSLRPCSPLLNRGDNGLLSHTLTEDLIGQTRIFGDKVDLGAYERQAPATDIQVTMEVIPPSSAGSTDGSITLIDIGGGTPQYAFLWNTGDTQPSLTGLSAGTYTLTVTDQMDCEEVFSIEVEAVNAVVDPMEIWGAQLAPNPVSLREGTATLAFRRWPGNGALVQIIDLQGRIVWQTKLESFATDQSISVPSSAGLYLVRVIDGQGRAGVLKCVVL